MWGLRWCAACGDEVLAIWGTCPVCDGPLSDRPARPVVRVGPEMRWCGKCGEECPAGEPVCPACKSEKLVTCAEIAQAGGLVVAA